MAERRYRGGPRSAYQQGPDRAAWTENFLGEFVITVNEPETERTGYYVESGPGENVHLYARLANARGKGAFSIALTFLTERELIELRDLVETAFKWAQPICRLRDQEAQRGWQEHGDDTNPRIYRRLPTVVYRSRPIERDSEGVPLGPARPDGLDQPEPPSPPGDSSLPGSVGASSDGVAEQLSEDRSAEDLES